MTTITITDLPDSRALDYRAMSAIRGASGAGDWCLYAFSPYQNFEIKDSGSGATNLNTSRNPLNSIHTG